MKDCVPKMLCDKVLTEISKLCVTECVCVRACVTKLWVKDCVCMTKILCDKVVCRRCVCV